MTGITLIECVFSGIAILKSKSKQHILQFRFFRGYFFLII
jgi:hypothetical protein